MLIKDEFQKCYGKIKYIKTKLHIMLFEVRPVNYNTQRLIQLYAKTEKNRSEENNNISCLNNGLRNFYILTNFVSFALTYYMF